MISRIEKLAANLASRLRSRSEASSSARFDVGATNMVKGVACCLLLWHHLFYQHPEYGILVHSTARISKICVTIFVVLSGYGLFVSSKHLSPRQFYWIRLSKLYIGFWCIYLIFVPISVVFFNRGLDDVFSGGNYILKLGFSFWGLQEYYGGHGFNATWWFMSAIIPLYLLFPFLSWGVKRYAWIVLVLGYLPRYFPVGQMVFHWMLPFCLGLVAAKYNVFCAFDSLIPRNVLAGRALQAVVLSVVLCLAVFLKGTIQCLYGPTIGIFFAFWIIQMCFFVHGLRSVFAQGLVTVLALVGRHSMNIFLFHTFLYYYFFPEFFYSLGSSHVVFFALMAACLAISVAIEFFKGIFGIHKIEKIIRCYSMREQKHEHHSIQ